MDKGLVNHIGELYGIMKHEDETDEEFKKRFIEHHRLRPDVTGPGVEKSFRDWKHRNVPVGLQVTLVVQYAVPPKHVRWRAFLAKIGFWFLKKGKVDWVR